MGCLVAVGCLVDALVRQRIMEVSAPNRSIGKSESDASLLSGMPFSLPFGALGPSGERENLFYYDVALAHMLIFGRRATSAIEIGCVKPAFVRWATWIPGQKTCVAPYHAQYRPRDEHSLNPVRDDAANDDVEYVLADFLEMPINGSESFDLCVCMQVLEHVPQPDDFLRKMLNTGLCKVVTISVPYRWKDCGSKCSHVTHMIDETVVSRWSGGREPVLKSIVRDGDATRLVITYAIAPL